MNNNIVINKENCCKFKETNKNPINGEDLTKSQYDIYKNDCAQFFNSQTDVLDDLSIELFATNSSDLLKSKIPEPKKRWAEMITEDEEEEEQQLQLPPSQQQILTQKPVSTSYIPTSPSYIPISPSYPTTFSPEYQPTSPSYPTTFSPEYQPTSQSYPTTFSPEYQPATPPKEFNEQQTLTASMITGRATPPKQPTNIYQQPIIQPTFTTDLTQPPVFGTPIDTRPLPSFTIQPVQPQPTITIFPKRPPIMSPTATYITDLTQPPSFGLPVGVPPTTTPPIQQPVVTPRITTPIQPPVEQQKRVSFPTQIEQIRYISPIEKIDFNNIPDDEIKELHKQYKNNGIYKNIINIDEDGNEQLEETLEPENNKIMNIPLAKLFIQRPRIPSIDVDSTNNITVDDIKNMEDYLIKFDSNKFNSYNIRRLFSIDFIIFPLKIMIYEILNLFFTKNDSYKKAYRQYLLNNNINKNKNKILPGFLTNEDIIQILEDFYNIMILKFKSNNIDKFVIPKLNDYFKNYENDIDNYLFYSGDRYYIDDIYVYDNQYTLFYYTKEDYDSLMNDKIKLLSNQSSNFTVHNIMSINSSCYSKKLNKLDILNLLKHIFKQNSYCKLFDNFFKKFDNQIEFYDIINFLILVYYNIGLSAQNVYEYDFENKNIDNLNQYILNCENIVPDYAYAESKITFTKKEIEDLCRVTPTVVPVAKVERPVTPVTKVAPKPAVAPAPTVVTYEPRKFFAKQPIPVPTEQVVKQPQFLQIQPVPVPTIQKIAPVQVIYEEIEKQPEPRKPDKSQIINTFIRNRLPISIFNLKATKYVLIQVIQNLDPNQQNLQLKSKEELVSIYNNLIKKV